MADGGWPQLMGSNKKINRSKLAHSVFTSMYQSYYFAHNEKY